MLVRDGWMVLSRNWRGGGAELDIVVRRGSALRFVEVKARTGDELDALESITAQKRSRLARGARAWLDAHQPAVDDIAFLIAVVDLSEEGMSVQWWDDAFDA